MNRRLRARSNTVTSPPTVIWLAVVGLARPVTTSCPFCVAVPVHHLQDLRFSLVWPYGAAVDAPLHPLTRRLRSRFPCAHQFCCIVSCVDFQYHTM